MYHIEKHFRKLFDMIDLRRPKDSGPGRAYCVLVAKEPAQSRRARGKSRYGGNRGVGRGQFDQLLNNSIGHGRPETREVRRPGRPLGL